MKRPYKVIKHITYEYECVIDEANSAEEAESLAEDSFDAPADATEIDNETVEVYAVDLGALGEAQEDEEENG